MSDQATNPTPAAPATPTVAPAVPPTSGPDVASTINEIESQVKTYVLNGVKNQFNSANSPLAAIDKAGSKVFKLSIRAWIAIVLVISFCAAIFLKIDPPAYFTSTVSMVIAFYFGSNAQGQQPAPTTVIK